MPLRFRHPRVRVAGAPPSLSRRRSRPCPLSLREFSRPLWPLPRSESASSVNGAGAGVGATEMAKPTAHPSSATYLYCLAQSKQPPSLAGVPPGLPGVHKPRALDAGGSLWLIAGNAPLALYGTGPIEAGLKDLDWVAERAVGHERVVEHFVEHIRGTVVPLKLF